MSTMTDQKDGLLVETLRKYWGFDSFLPLQAEAMECVLSGRDSVVVLPTGGGKSLCFQAPAMCMDGLAVVVSPLISLMKDQVDSLRTCGVPAAFANSTLSAQERRQVADDVRSGRLRLLYLAPERLLTEGTIDFLKGNAHVSLVAIDEAHCISSWGHDFRPEYRGLRVLKDVFPNVGIHAYTATASDKVRQDIAEQLGLADPEILVGSFDRPNLVYKVQRRANRLSQIREVMDRHAGESGIIYCISRKDVDETAAALSGLGYRVLPYHAGMSDNDRRHNQEAFIEEKVDTIVATVAFGMGIDKSNVRYVIHAGMPKSLENYQQESGRAGRDGLEAECCLFYAGNDFSIWKSMVDESEPAARDGALTSLSAMSNFCTSVTCRHQAIVGHFGQQLERVPCGACDVCLGQLDLVDDPLVVGQKILSCVLRLQQRFGGDYTAKVLSGSQEQRIMQQRHNELSTWGLLADENLRNIRDWIEQLVSQNFLEKVGEYNILQVTPDGRRLLKGELTPRLLQPAKSAKDAKTLTASDVDSWEGVDRGLFDVLRKLRHEKALVKEVPADIVFGDAPLRDMARRRPSTLDGFRQVKGVGEKKMTDYGQEFVESIVAYCREHEVSMDVQPAVVPDSASAPRPKSAPGVNAITAFPLFREGLSVQEVAQKLGRALSTTYGYLMFYIDEHKITDPTPWVDAATVERITQAIDQVGVERLKPIFDALEGTVPYEQIRIVVGCLKNRA
jgi:ATP-dependent DNA helicase RecQ